MKGVREVCAFGNRAVVLSEDLKDTVVPNVLYSVELKPMHKAKGYVVVAAMNYSLGKVSLILVYSLEKVYFALK